jgi:hypothetical protein
VIRTIVDLLSAIGDFASVAVLIGIALGRLEIRRA